ncbi:MAG: protein YgfX [Gammaproteobacteria bacterium]
MSAAVAIRLALPEGPTPRLALRFVHFVAAALALVACGPTPAGCLLAGALLLHLCWLEARRRALAASLLAVLFDSAGVWHLQWRDGTRERARLAPGAVVSPWLTILTLDGPRARIGLFVTPDMLDADSFRRLRMRLLWQRATTEF